jgi:hypothetical protein
MTNSIFEHREQIKRDAKLFRSMDAKTATELIERDPAEYARLKACDRAGDPGPSSGVRRGLQVRHFVNVSPERSADELMARIANPESEVRKFYATQGNSDPAYDLARLARENPTAYESVRLAAMSYGIIERSATRPQRRPIDAEPQGSTNPLILGERLGNLTSLEPTTEVSKETFFKLIEHADKLDAAKAAA